MASIRQSKISELIKRDLSSIFQREARSMCKGAMVTVTTVRVTKDLSIAKAYLSIFGIADKNIAFDSINSKKTLIRMELAKIMKNQMRKVPEFQFFIDDSLEHIDKIEKSLKGEENPIKNPDLLDKHKKA